MRLLLIIDDFLPHSNKIAARMIYDLAVELQCKNHQVVVLTPSAKLIVPLLIDSINGVEIVYFRSRKIKYVNKVIRAINETLLSFLAWKTTKNYFSENSFDGIIYYSPSIFFGPLVNKLKKKWNIKSYLILRDIFPKWTVDSGLIKKGSLVYYYFKFFEKINYCAADKIGVMSNENLQFFDSVADFHKYEVLNNWIKIKLPRIAMGQYRHKFALQNKIIFFYGGNIGRAQHITALIQLVKEFKDDDRVCFLFIGDGDEVNLLLEEKRKNNLYNLIYLSSVKQNIYEDILSEIDVGIFSLHPDHKTHNFPGKIMGYMEHSKPIVGFVNRGNDLRCLVHKYKAGYIDDYSDYSSVIFYMKKLIQDAKFRENIGKNGRILLEENFNAKQISEQILELFA